jgi:membrane protein
VTERLRTLIADHAPASTQELLNSIVDRAIAEVGGGAASLGIVLTLAVALWSGSNAIGALIKSFNRAYDVEDQRGFVRGTLLRLGLTLSLAFAIDLALVLLVFGQRISVAAAGELGLESWAQVAIDVLRWPLMIAGLAALLAVLYHYGPDITQSFAWITPGSIVATALWLAALAGFGLFLRFSNPGSAYGALGSLAVLIFFLYLTGLVILMGAELNALLAQRLDPETQADIARHPGSDAAVTSTGFPRPSRSARELAQGG